MFNLSIKIDSKHNLFMSIKTDINKYLYTLTNCATLFNISNKKIEYEYEYSDDEDDDYNEYNSYNYDNNIDNIDLTIVTYQDFITNDKPVIVYNIDNIKYKLQFKKDIFSITKTKKLENGYNKYNTSTFQLTKDELYQFKKEFKKTDNDNYLN